MSKDINASRDHKSHFTAQWTNGDAPCLNPSKPSKPHRAWERQPRSPFAQQSRFRKVWRRYSLKSQHSLPPNQTHSSPSISQQSPQKVTKKLCLSDGGERYRGAATRWETERPIRSRTFFMSNSFTSESLIRLKREGTNAKDRGCRRRSTRG